MLYRKNSRYPMTMLARHPTWLVAIEIPIADQIPQPRIWQIQ